MTMNEYKVVYTKLGLKEKKYAVQAGFKDKIDSLLAILKENPFEAYPPFERLLGSMKGAYSRRINRQHRLVYMVYEKERIVKVISCWTHYDNIK